MNCGEFDSSIRLFVVESAPVSSVGYLSFSIMKTQTVFLAIGALIVVAVLAQGT